MITKLSARCAVLLTTALTLAACGGGGGGGAAEPPPPPPPVVNASFNIELRVDDPQLSANTSPLTFGPGTEFATQINIRVTEANGQPVRNLNAQGDDDGADLVVTLSLNQGQLGGLSLPGQPETQADSLDLTVDGSGNATAVFYTSDLTGTVELTASAIDRDAGQANAAGVFPGVLVTTAQTITIDMSTEPPRPTMTFEVGRTAIPANRFGVLPFLNSPYMAEVVVTFRDSFGNLTDPEGGIISVTMSPVTLGAFSTLDDPSTADNEFEVLLGTGPVDVGVDGDATFFVHSFDTRGELRARVSARDPETGIQLEETLVFTIVEPASDGRPADVGISITENTMYVQDSGGLTTQSFDVFVFDGAEEPVDDPTTNNNVLLEIFTEGPNTGEILRSTGVAGAQMRGTSIRIGTLAGVTNANLTTGTEPGFLRLRATADAQDNNIENGIQVPVRDEIIIDISDGIPFAVTLGDVSLSALSPAATAVGTNIIDPNPADPFDLRPDSIYRMQLSALVTDRRGNPPARPVTLHFGLLDAPVVGFPEIGRGFFDHSGVDGNPAEGGVSFTSQSANFIRPQTGRGVGPNDTLVLFGRDVPGNEDLELARELDFVISDTVLQVDEAFNRNDTTGVSIDTGPTIPWAVGRAMLGNVDAGAQTNEDGIATAFMRYPLSAIGHAAIVYVQGTNGDLGSAGNFHTFADVALFAYPGISGVIVTASPNQIPANGAFPSTVCVFDSAGTAIPGVVINFTATIEIGEITVDGVPAQGTVANPTGFDGCTIANIESAGVPAGIANGVVNFIVGSESATVEVVPDANAILQVQPGFILGDSAARTITIRYLDGAGQPVEGIQIVGSCDSPGGEGLFLDFLQLPGITDADGETTAVLRVIVDSCDTPGSATCTFTTATGEPSGEVMIEGRDLDVLFSPSICP